MPCPKVVLEVKWSFEQKTYVYLESVARLMVSSKKNDKPREDKGGSKLTILEASGSSGVAFFLPSGMRIFRFGRSGIQSGPWISLDQYVDELLNMRLSFCFSLGATLDKS